ncbi:hypothetical protein EH223_16150 [candidate division KSB1 bacterium]|nr:hypothetical protein [candidate division KSB1 bacterium]RQW01059.1 MAG: hypothetical protein EH223_16150 [candidate division KSB1 bacterium]
MWSLLKTELTYQKNTLFFILAFHVALIIYSFFTTVAWVFYFWPFYIACFLPYGLFINAAKEKRTIVFAKLPLQSRALALYRIVIVLIFTLFLLGTYYTLLAVAHREFNPDLKKVLVMTGLIFSIYGFAYIYRDLFREFILRHDLTRERVAPYLVLAGIILQIGLIFALFAKPSNSSGLDAVMEVLIHKNPLLGESGHLWAMIPGIILILISLFTFEHSKVRY